MSASPVILAFLIGSFFTGLDLVTGKYPRTWFLVRQSRLFWIYCGIYGTISAAGYLASDALIAAGKIQLDSEVLGSPWLRAVVVGISIKSFLHINLFNVTVNSQPFPVGLETLVQVFEPPMLRTILFDEFNAVRHFVAPLAAKHPDVSAVRQTIIQNIPPTLPGQEVGAFKDELSKAADATDAMEKGLRFLGKKTFVRIFPP